MFRVLSAPIIRSTIKTADAIIGTVHVSVWFKSVERCPSSGVYFTMPVMMHGTTDIKKKHSLLFGWFHFHIESAYALSWIMVVVMLKRLAAVMVFCCCVFPLLQASLTV
jgi:hypothetical protein